MSPVDTKMIQDYLTSLAFNDEPEDIIKILSLVDKPFIENGIDVLSMIFNRFYKHTDTPMALPIFGFFSVISAWLVKNKANMLIPLTQKPTELATWVMALAESGSNKTLAMNQIFEMIPEDPTTGDKIVKPNFDKPNGPSAMVKQMAELPEGRGYWFLDEASQMFKLLEQPGHPMAEIKETLLKIKDHSKVTRITSKEKIEVDGIVLTQFFINTIDSMSKSISDESMTDGLFRRYQVAMAENDSSRPFEKFPLYNLQNIIDPILTKELFEVFNRDIGGKTFNFSNDCFLLYNEMFPIFWERQYKKIMVNTQNFYRTYMMESWKYAVFHHIIHKKQGLEVQVESLHYGLRVCLFLLSSLQSFIGHRAKKENVTVCKSKITKLMDFIQENEEKPNFSLRMVSRKFNLKKEEVIENLNRIKNVNPEFKTKLF